MICPNIDIEWNGELEVVVPSVLDGKTVTILERWASETGAISVIVPDTVTELGYSCFRSAKIKRVYIPSSVVKIDVSAFDLNENNVELYYGGTEEMKNIIVYHLYDLADLLDWAVTGYDWLAKPYTNDTNGTGRDYTTEIKAVYYNADPKNLPPVEDLIEKEPVEPTIWDKSAEAFQNFSNSIVVFFEKVANFFASIFA